MSINLITAQCTGICPNCKGDFETCRCTGAAPRAGTIDDIESEDDRLDYEPDEVHRRLGQYLLRMVREADARIPAERRTPRTLQEMNARTAGGIR